MNPLLAELRPQFLAASILPVFLGGAYALLAAGVFNPALFLATLAGVVCLHAGANLANEVFDFRNGTDRANANRSPFSGGTGLLPAGAVAPRSVFRLALACFLLSGLAGLYLTLARGPAVLALGLFGALSGYLYTAPPAALSGRGVGELLVGLNFGVLAVAGTVFVQTGSLALAPAIASLPLAFLITAVLFINEVPDCEADSGAGKRTLVVRLGRPRSASVFAALLALAYLSLAGAAALGFLPVLSLLALLTLPLAGKAARTAQKQHSSFPGILPANRSTVLAHLFTGIILAATVFAAAVL